MSLALSARGYRVLVARDGAEALDLLGREEGIDLVVTDLVMPRVGGAELVRRLDELGLYVPVVCMSG